MTEARVILLLLAMTFAAHSLQAQSAAPLPDAPWLRSDSAARTVTLDLAVAPANGAPSASIAGHREGGVQIVVPLGWTVRWTWHSADSTTPHSLVLMAEREKIPAEGGQPAFSNAMTRMLTKGLPAGRNDETSFVADQPGWYWLLCGVPSHALTGEWIGLRVDPEATGAGVRGK